MFTLHLLLGSRRSPKRGHSWVIFVEDFFLTGQVVKPSPVVLSKARDVSTALRWDNEINGGGKAGNLVRLPDGSVSTRYLFILYIFTNIKTYSI